MTTRRGGQPRNGGPAARTPPDRAGLAPEVLAERCVHTVIQTASCRACVDACPLDAWVLDDDMLGIDSEACDGCGLCAAACPEGAIGHPHAPARRYWEGADLALLACERSAAARGEGIVPCLHALGLGELIGLQQAGVRTLVTAEARCDACPRGRAPRLEGRLARCNALLRDRGLSELAHRSLPARSWTELLSLASVDARGPVISRRDLLRRTVDQVVSAADEATRELGGEAGPAPASGLGTDGLMPAWPRIDSAACDGCGACARVCPHAAIVDAPADMGRPERLEVRAERCTGCRICVDVCAPGAVKIQEWSPVEVETVPLTSYRCQECGAPVRRPGEARAGERLCVICARGHHHRLLYQVLE